MNGAKRAVMRASSEVPETFEAPDYRLQRDLDRPPDEFRRGGSAGPVPIRESRGIAGLPDGP
jgi:hypothetical protein